MKVLIVDDSELIRKRLIEILDDFEEFEVAGIAGSAEEAYPYCNGSCPEIIILDIHLPGENGIKILEKIRKKNKEVKIIILTNFPFPQYQKKCMELGADYFVDKSSEFASISVILKEIYEGRKSLSV